MTTLPCWGECSLLQFLSIPLGSAQAMLSLGSFKELPALRSAPSSLSTQHLCVPPLDQQTVVGYADAPQTLLLPVQLLEWNVRGTWQ